MVKLIKKNKTIYAKIFKLKFFKRNETVFYTSLDDELQLGLISKNKNSKIMAHKHKPKKRVITNTSEVLLLISGLVIVNFYDETDMLFKKETLKRNDILLIFKGGHSFEFIKDSKLIEIKQGPYLNDKIFI